MTYYLIYRIIIIITIILFYYRLFESYEQTIYKCKKKKNVDPPGTILTLTSRILVTLFEVRVVYTYDDTVAAN